LTFRQFEEMQQDNAAQRVTLQKAPAKSSFCPQTLIYQKALPIGIQYWQFIPPPADWDWVNNSFDCWCYEKAALLWCSLADGSATRTWCTLCK